jgi:hypothetical protein
MQRFPAMRPLPQNHIFPTCGPARREECGWPGKKVFIFFAVFALLYAFA